MKKYLLFFCLIQVITCISACSSEEDKDPNILKIGLSTDEMIGENYQTIISELEEVGFTNIETKVLDDLITGWLTKDGEIEQVEISGATEFSANDSFDKDSKIVIAYHTFPEDDESYTKSADVNTSETVEQTENVNIEEELPEILTIENNEELAEMLLLKDEHDPSVGEFVKKYKGKTIQFNSHIAYIAPHKDYKTRYDFLIYVGDYNENSSGPNFKFENVNISELKIKNSEIPDFLEVNQNLLITAEVEEYNENSGLFFLKPISTELK